MTSERFQLYIQEPFSEDFIYVGDVKRYANHHGSNEPKLYLTRQEAVDAQDALKKKGLAVLIVNCSHWTGYQKELHMPRRIDPGQLELSLDDSEVSGVRPAVVSIRTGSD